MTKGMYLLVLAGLILALILNSIFVIDEKEDGIVFQFGEAVRPDVSVGIHFKIPLIQNVKNGKTELIDIPIPKPLYGKVLIRTTRSLISLGTEKMLVNFAKSNFLSGIF